MWVLEVMHFPPSWWRPQLMRFLGRFNLKRYAAMCTVLFPPDSPSVSAPLLLHANKLRLGGQGGAGWLDKILGPNRGLSDGNQFPVRLGSGWSTSSG